MNWKKDIFDCNFSRYTSGDFEIVQDVDVYDYQLNKSGQFVALCNTVQEAKNLAETYSQLN